MRSLSVDSLTPDMVVGHHIYSAKGLVLLAKGMPLTSDLIGRICDLGIRHVFVEDKETEGIEVRDAVPVDVRQRTEAFIFETFSRVSERREFASPSADAEQIRSIAEDLLEGLREHPGECYNVISLKTYDEFTYQHSANVAVLSMVIGETLRLRSERMIPLGMGALLHDLGKTQVPLDILNKRDALTSEEFAALKQHTRAGFEILMTNSNLNPLSINIALSHHERLNGTGYPNGISGEELHQFTRIVTVADIYDALTSPGPRREALTPYAALRILTHNTFRLLDQNIVGALAQAVMPFPIGFGVRVSTGFAGVVAALNPTDSYRPIVRLLYAPGGARLEAPCDVDLGSSQIGSISHVTIDAGPESLRRLATSAAAPIPEQMA